MSKPFGIERAALYPIGLLHGLLPRARRRGVGGGCRRAGVGWAHPARGAYPPPPPHPWRGGARWIATKTQKLRPPLYVNTRPNHVLPLAHFGAIHGVCDGGVVRTDHHNAGERNGSTQQYDLKVHHASVGGW
jgi:hypothetical protein